MKNGDFPQLSHSFLFTRGSLPPFSHGFPMGCPNVLSLTSKLLSRTSVVRRKLESNIISYGIVMSTSAEDSRNDWSRLFGNLRPCFFARMNELMNDEGMDVIVFFFLTIYHTYIITFMMYTSVDLESISS